MDDPPNGLWAIRAPTGGPGWAARTVTIDRVPTACSYWRSSRKSSRAGKSITSKEVVRKLATDELSVWADYGKGGKGGGAITERQIAGLLKPYKIYPDTIGPTHSRLHGYRAKDFQDAFARYLHADPRICASEAASRHPPVRQLPIAISNSPQHDC